MTFSQLCGYLTLHCIVINPNFLPLVKERDHNIEEGEVREKEPIANKEDEGYHDTKVTTGN